ncbi:MAG: hypothetical protein KJO54_09055 [Gammaproteobacteria bacterium]|nr:hypothetical protein [Gammaproteobacteria bacterium]NNF61173.1 hypothetical protein [Gammaproteobacteria bacterium]NNM19868.1 hypothetical protein [Gammaproteobacteria bacterium]
MKAMRPLPLVMLLLSAFAASTSSADTPNVQPLDLERKCTTCHDVANPGGLTGADWLSRMHAMGPVENLSADQRNEVVGFLRHHGVDVNQILAVTEQRYLFEEKCGMCHSVGRAFLEPITNDEFRAIVERMRRRAPQWISAEDAERIIAYMAGGARGITRPEHNEINGGPAEVFKGRCAGCHPLERSYLYVETKLDPAWPLLVKRMQLKAPDWISDAEAAQIAEYLSSLEPQLR